MIISSATLDAETIKNYYEDEQEGFACNIVYVEGRMFPVEINYLKNPCKNYITKAVEAAFNIHIS